MSSTKPRCKNCTQPIELMKNDQCYCYNCGFWMERVDGVWKLLPVRGKK